MTAVLGVFHGPARQRRPADFGLRIGPANTASRGPIQFAIRLEPPDDNWISFGMAKGARIKFLELLAPRVVRTRLQPTGVDLIPNFPKWDTLSAVQASFGCSKTDLFPSRVILWSAVPIVIRDGIEHLRHI